MADGKQFNRAEKSNELHQTVKPETAAAADQPVEYQSSPEDIAHAREMMHDIKEALTKGADGQFSAKFAEMDWDGMNMWPITTGWRDMDAGERYDLLLHALKETFWDLERVDSRKLAFEFVDKDARQAMPGFRAEAFNAVMTRLEAFGDEFKRLEELAGKFREFVSEAYVEIARLAEMPPPVSRDMTAAPAADAPPPRDFERMVAERVPQPPQPAQDKDQEIEF